MLAESTAFATWGEAVGPPLQSSVPLPSPSPPEPEQHDAASPAEGSSPSPSPSPRHREAGCTESCTGCDWEPSKLSSPA